MFYNLGAWSQNPTIDFLATWLKNEPRHEKTWFRGFRLGPNLTGYKPQKINRSLIIRSDLGSRGIVLGYVANTNSADYMRGYRASGLRLCFHIQKGQVFSRRGSFFLMSCGTNSQYQFTFITETSPYKSDPRFMENL